MKIHSHELMEEFAEQLTRATGDTVCVEKEVWSSVIRPGITRVATEYSVWYYSTKKSVKFSSFETLARYVERKLILFRKF